MRLCRHYLGIAAAFVLLGVTPALTGRSVMELFITPGYFGTAALGIAMVVAAVLDHRVLTRLFPFAGEQLA